MSAQELFEATGLSAERAGHGKVELSEEAVRGMDDMLDYAIETYGSLQ